MGSRQTFTEKRRRQLARKVGQLDRFESRSMIAESLGIAMLGIGIPSLAAMIQKHGGDRHGASLQSHQTRLGRHIQPFSAAPVHRAPRPEGGGGSGTRDVKLNTQPVVVPAGDWLALKAPKVTDEFPPAAGAAQMIDAIKKSAQRTGGGAATQPHGGGAGGGSVPHGAITPLQLAFPSQDTSSATLNALGASVGGSNGSFSHASRSAGLVTSSSAAFSQPNGFQTIDTSKAGALPPTSMIQRARILGGGLSALSMGNSSGVALGQFTYFPMYVIDLNQGQTIFPGTLKQGTRGGNVDLRVQVRDTTISSISWNTSGLGSDATSITGGSTYNLKYQWQWTGAATTTDSVSVTVTNTLGQAQTQTFNFALPYAITGFGSGTGTATWPTSLSADTVRAGVSFPSHYATVDSNSGALDTDIMLPSYNPNIAPIVLTYDSTTADARPIVLFPHELDSTLAVPTKVSAKLTFNSVAGTTWYYDTSMFMAGDFQQIALQANATALSTGRYAYSATIADIRGTNTTFTITGNTNVVNYSGGAIGSGWTVKGLEQITTATGGVILDLGMGGKSLWFSGSPGAGSNYTSPAGEFSSLTLNSGGSYTRTLTGGTQINFNSSGQQIATVDTNALRVTYAYTSGRLSTITDPYAKITTFAYDGSNKLLTIKDPASRTATFTHSGANLTGVTMPDSSTWGYAYDGSGRLTQITDQRSKNVTVAYDSVQRVSTITLPDSSAQKFTAYQEMGWTNSGTLGSPAAATLLAAAPATYTDQLNNVTQERPDWNGQGLPNVVIDPDGNVASFDRDANGLPTVVVDRLNQISQFAYDATGNVTAVTNPDATTKSYTYNSFSEVTRFTDENSHQDNYTYDSGGNLTVAKDALNNLTTMTYTANGMVATRKDARLNTTSYAYDSQDRLTTVTYPDTSTTKIAYDSNGNPTTHTNELGNVVVARYDAMNRLTNATDPLNSLHTFVYDSGGNLTVAQAPLSRTTSYAYDSMSRLTTLTDPLSHVTVLGYDANGNMTSVKDPLARITTVSYDAENRPAVVVDRMSNRTTTAYDANGQPTLMTDPMGRVTTTTYDLMGRVATVTDPLGNVVTHAYTATGRPSTVSNPTSPGNYTAYYIYNANDMVTQFTDGLTHTTTYGYDANNNRTGTTDGNGHATAYAYDSRNRLTTITDALSHTTVYGYDSGGNRTAVTDGLGHTTATAYDALNRATTVTDALSQTTVIGFDAASRRTVVVDPKSNRTSYAYDAADNLTTLTTPIGTATYVYDTANQLTDQTNANSKRTTFAYDSGGRRTNERWLTSSGGTVETLTYTYDADGELTAVIDPNATLTFTYDSGGNQITARTSSAGGQPNVLLTSGFDANHNRTTLADNLSSAGLTTYTYDLAQRLTKEAQSFGGTSGPQVAFGYDSANYLTTLSRTIGGTGTQVNTTLSYDAANRNTTITHAKVVTIAFPPSTTTTPLATYVYGYDAANRVTTETNAEGTVTYSYDITNQLSGAAGSRAETYTYDSGGNRTMTSYTTGSDNELTASPGYTYTYDAEGNLTAKTETTTSKIWTFTWDYRNRLAGVTQKNSGGTAILQTTYTYDALNRWIGTQVDDDGAGPHAAVQTWMVWDRQNPYAQFSSAGALQQRYLYGLSINQIFARTDSGGTTTTWYLTDKQGSVRDNVNTSGTVVNHVVYDSFGSVLTETSPSNGDQFKYGAMQYDSSTGLYFDHARYYIPALGRFLSKDPIAYDSGDANLYRYCMNAPTNFRDPTGEATLDVLSSYIEDQAAMPTGMAQAAFMQSSTPFGKAPNVPQLGATFNSTDGSGGPILTPVIDGGDFNYYWKKKIEEERKRERAQPRVDPSPAGPGSPAPAELPPPPGELIPPENPGLGDHRMPRYPGDNVRPTTPIIPGSPSITGPWFIAWTYPSLPWRRPGPIRPDDVI